MFKPSDVVYQYDHSYEGFLSCVFESFLKKECPENIVADDTPQLFLTPSRRITTDEKRASRVAAFLPRCLGRWKYHLFLYGFLSHWDRKEINLLLLIQKSYHKDPLNLGEEPLNNLFAHAKQVEYEVHRWKGFIRFSDYNHSLVAVIHPENYILPMLAGHFCQRYPGEELLIFDESHQTALICRHGTPHIFSLESLCLPSVSEEERHCRSLWQQYYCTAAVESRLNPSLRRRFIPKRFWKDMIELSENAKYQSPISKYTP